MVGWDSFGWSISRRTTRKKCPVRRTAKHLNVVDGTWWHTGVVSCCGENWPWQKTTRHWPPVYEQYHAACPAREMPEVKIHEKPSLSAVDLYQLQDKTGDMYTLEQAGRSCRQLTTPRAFICLQQAKAAVLEDVSATCDLPWLVYLCCGEHRRAQMVFSFSPSFLFLSVLFPFTLFFTRNAKDESGVFSGSCHSLFGTMTKNTFHSSDGICGRKLTL